MKSIYYLHFDTIASTNSWAKEMAHTLDRSHLTCITARAQSAGRGRFNRPWISGSGENIAATLFFTLPKESPIVANLGQILSLSCITVLEAQGISPQIKWPNDLVLDGKKLAGILCETISLQECLGIALGIGINVNASEEFLKAIGRPAISLKQLSGHPWKLELILDPLLKRFLHELDILEKRGFSPFRNEYEKRLAFRGDEISCKHGPHPIRGICHSVSDDGKLNLLLPSGEIATLSAGEIST